MMDKLLLSRKNKDEYPEKLEHISPEKYGKGAYCELTYTPSKLADNVLFREASNLKRIEEETSKSRGLEAENKMLADQVEYLKKERDGISESLNQIITMYKKILSEMESKNEERVKEVQKRFKEEMLKFICDKEEEAKYFQSEKEIFQARIEELETIISRLNEEILQREQHKSALESQFEKLQINFDHLKQKLAENEEKYRKESTKGKQDYDELTKKFMIAEVEWKKQLQDQLHKKDLEIQSIERAYRAELEKVQNQRATENLLKTQQLHEISKVFESEAKRLNEIISMKDRMIETLNAENSKEKSRILNLTRDYESEINHLAHEKNRLFDEIEIIGRENEVLVRDRKMIAGELERENNKLRELLLESSVELEKCKAEFISLGKENAHLMGRLRNSEEEAKTWRDSYYLNKTRPL